MQLLFIVDKELDYLRHLKLTDFFLLLSALHADNIHDSRRQSDHQPSETKFELPNIEWLPKYTKLNFN